MALPNTPTREMWDAMYAAAERYLRHCEHLNDVRPMEIANGIYNAARQAAPTSVSCQPQTEESDDVRS